jgi:hypothetical protein
VDLRHPDALKKNLDDRFVGRVLLPEEKHLISYGSDPGRTLWQLWAAKETAYKIVSKSHPAVHSGPQKYRVTLSGVCSISSTLPSCHSRRIRCLVETPVGGVTIVIQNEDDYVHAFGCSDDRVDLETLHPRVFRLDEGCLAGHTDSDAVREELCLDLGRLWGIPAGEIDIRRSPGERGAGPPMVYVSEKPASVDISLSHHGRYGAFVWLVDQS